MPLTKTTIVPPGNPNAILALPILKMIVIVNDAAIAQTADDLAQLPPIIDRQAIWFPDGLPGAYEAMFQINNLATAVAFSVTPNNKVADIIRQDEEVDAVRMDMAYTKAGL